MRTDKNVSQVSFRQSNQWRTDPFKKIRDPEIDRRLKGAEVINGRMVVHSLSGKERNHLFLNHNAEFSDLSLISGIDSEADSRGFVTFDYDRDGMLDIALVNANKPLLNLYRNNMKDVSLSESNGFIAVRFVGGNNTNEAVSKKANRDGFGAMVELELGDVKLKREHRCGEGYGTQNSSTMIIGIGSSKTVDRVAIKWPSGESFQHTSIPVGSLVTTYEIATQSPNQLNFAVETYKQSINQPSRTSQSEKPSAFDLGAVAIYPEPDSSKTPKLRLYVSMATWCTACLKHKPDLQLLAESCAPDLEIIGLPIDESEDDDRLRAYVEQHKPPYGVVLSLTSDQRRRIHEVFSFINPPDALPSSILTDASGRLIAGKPGVPTVSDVRQQLSRFQNN